MKNRVAQTKPGDFSLGQIYEFAAAFGRQGGNPDLLQALIEDRAQMAFAVELARGNNLPKGCTLARLFLGHDFISTEEVAAAYSFSYTEQQIMQLETTLPDIETLKWLRDNDYMLVAGPATDLNLLGVHTLDRSLFWPNEKGKIWFEQALCTFSSTDMVQGGQWLMLRKSSVPNSQLKSWSKQVELLLPPEHVPNVTEVSYGVGLYRKVHGIYLLSDTYVRTSSVYADGIHVIVGHYNEQGLNVGHEWDERLLGDLGVSSARS